MLAEEDATDKVTEAFLDAVAARLSPIVATLENEPWFMENAGIHYHYLAIDEDSPFRWIMEKNVGRCSRCGRWTSDYKAPDYLDLLMIGEMIEGKLYCDECTFYLDRMTSSCDLGQGGSDETV